MKVYSKTQCKLHQVRRELAGSKAYRAPTKVVNFHQGCSARSRRQFLGCVPERLVQFPLCQWQRRDYQASGHQYTCHLFRYFNKLQLMFLADNCAWQKGCAPFTAQSNAYMPNVGGVLMITSFGSRTTRINKSIN